MKEIKPYIFNRKGGFDWYHYLHIQGGQGHGKKGLGGRYKFCVLYLTPDQSEEMKGISPDIYCKENEIPCGVGDTIEEAYADYQSKS